MNIDFGSTPPADTSKLWVPLSNKPDFVKCSPVLSYGNFANTTIGTAGSNTRYLTGYQNCLAGDWLYFIGPSIYDNINQVYSNYIRRINIKTAVQENVVRISADTVSDQYGYAGQCGAVVNGVCYFMLGRYKRDSSFQGEPKQVWEYNPSTGELNTYTFTAYTTDYGSFFTTCVVGDIIYCFGGYDYWDNKYNTKGYKFNTTTKELSDISSPCGYGCSCCAVGTDIYMLGGRSNTNYYVYKFDTLTDTYSIVPSWTTPRLGSASIPTVFRDNVIYVLGDCYTSSTSRYMHTLNLETGEYKQEDFRFLAGTAGTAWGVSGNDVYFMGGEGYNEQSPYLQKFSFVTSLEKNHLFLQADFGFDNPFPVVKGQKSEFEAYLRNAYIGDSNNIAQLTNAYIYDNSTNQWKTLSGESYILDTLNALNILGVN